MKSCGFESRLSHHTRCWFGIQRKATTPPEFASKFYKDEPQLLVRWGEFTKALLLAEKRFERKVRVMDFKGLINKRKIRRQGSSAR